MVVRGIVMDILSVSDNVKQVIIRVKKDEVYLPVSFTAFQNIIILMNQINLVKGDGVKITYYLKSKKFENKYSTSAIIEKLSITNKLNTLNLVDLETGEYI